MLKYLIVQLDDTSASFCHYPNKRTKPNLIALDTLKKALIWAMKENLMVQFVYPAFELPPEYREVIDSVDHIDIEPEGRDADVSVFNGVASLKRLTKEVFPRVVLRLTKQELFESVDELEAVLSRQDSFTIVITDLETFANEDFKRYKEVLGKLSDAVLKQIEKNRPMSLNLLTDRLSLQTMNNCNAGDESITLAPDGNFYICPAFYLDGEKNIGNPDTGVKIPNERLYRLSHAPICRTCDAYQCKRCVWLNQKTTLEVNTPSHQQCVVAHLERNASRQLLEKIKEKGIIRTDISIPEIDYLDPFENIKR